MGEITKKIYYHDTDAGGVVYYANYLKYLEEARTEYLSRKSLSIKELAQTNTLFVVKKVEIDYKAPACYGDELLIITEITKVKNISLEFSQDIKRADKLLVRAKTQLVCIDSSFSPKVLPDEVVEALNK